MEESPTLPRSKRQKIDKTGRFSALEKLKQLKGSKNKYQVDEIAPVYEEVDEKKYLEEVIKRQNDDWIDDDGGVSGYCEYGQDIFDDDFDVETTDKASKQSQKGPKKRKRDSDKDNQKGKISSMFQNMSNKKKTVEKINDDEIFLDLVSELNKDDGKEEMKKINAKSKFLAKPKNKESDDDKILNNLFNEENQKPKENLDDFDDSIFNPPIKKASSKPVIKSIDTLQKPLLIKNNTVSTKITESEKNIADKHQDLELDNFEFQDLDASDFIEDVNEPNSKTVPQESKITPTENLKKTTEDLKDYVGDISDIDFGNTEMDVCESRKVIQSEKRACDDINSKTIDEGWNEIFSVSQPNLSTASSKIDKDLQFPTIIDSNGDKIFRFFWYDAFEDPYSQPGIVYLFGKVYIDSIKEYVSCCIKIKDIDRKLYLLPSEFIKNTEDQETTMNDVTLEANAFKKKHFMKEMRFRDVEKLYAFDREGTPRECNYLEVSYPFTYPPILDVDDWKSVEAVFGASSNPLELFLIHRNIKGPCWLDIKAPLPANSFSWSKVHVLCPKMNNVSISPEQNSMGIPPIVLATINVQVSLDSNLQKNEIVMIGVLIHHKYNLDKAPPKPAFDEHYCLITHPKNIPWPMYAKDKLSKIKQTTVIRCESEYDLLKTFLNLMGKSEPDVIIGYDCDYQFDVLLSRMSFLKVDHWSKIGKLNRSKFPLFKGKIIINQAFCGRPICDISNTAKELNLKLKSYNLTSLAVAVLKKKESDCKEISSIDCHSFYSSAEKLENLIKIVMCNTVSILSISVELNILPLALQITNIAGNTLSKTLSGGRSERNEFLLLHAFHNKNYITPDKQGFNKKKNSDNQTTSKKKAAYAGGLVLEPKKGFYDKLILLMDFNSLYPSIIQEYNLCFTTVPGAAYADVEDLTLPEGNLEPGVVPTEIRKLVESRVQVKQLLKAPNLSPELKMQYHIRQLALKLTANSMYGCLGAAHCRFYAKGLAALVTLKGREILQNTKSLVEKANYDVIYGDTDSIMINTNLLDYEEVFNVGKEIKQKVNKLYKKVELDIDGVFRYLLLLKKKKYAAVTMNKSPNGEIQLTKEIKGLDIVRRDWCSLACDVGNKVLDYLLNDETNDTRLENIFELLQNVGNNLRNNKVPLHSLVITKQLSKNPSDYPKDKRSQLSHIVVALRLNEQGGRKWKAGDTIPFIICDDGTEKSPTERAYHIDEFKKSDTLKIDVNYYLSSQIHPVILRICDPIEGIDDALLAENLGIENYKSTRKIHTNDEEVPISINENRFEKCLPLLFNCPNKACKTEIEIKSVFREFPDGIQPALSKCTNPECNLFPYKYAYAIQNKIQMDIRKFVSNYYFGEVECENPSCSKKMRKITLDTYGTFPKCYECKDGNVHRIYAETDLYDQLSYYMHLFTLNPSHLKNTKTAPNRDLTAAYDNLKEFVEIQIQCNAYSVVDLTKIFWSDLQESDADLISNIEGDLAIEDLNEYEDDFIEEEKE